MKWDLTHMYKSTDDWDKNFKKIEKLVDELVTYKGNLKNNLEEFFIKSEEADIIMADLYVYAHFALDLDMSNQEAAARAKKIENLNATNAEKMSWESSELLSIGEEEIMKLVEKSSKLKEYRHTFDALFYSKEHILDEDKEKLLSYFSNFSSTPNEIYKAFRYADDKSFKLKLGNGKTIDVMDQNYNSLIKDTKDQQDRKKIFETFYKQFEDNKNMLANLYLSIVKKDVAYSKARNYESTLHSYLHSDKVPIDVYMTLIKTARANSNYLKKYLKLRKKVLGLSHYYSFDKFVPLTNVNTKYSYSEAKRLVLESIKDLPKDYIEKIESAIQDGFVDVLPSKTKRGGAYSWSAYRSHPYILLNYDKSLDYILTLAHEAGHSAHSMYSKEAQPYATHDYSIFVAEVASTFSERMVTDYLLKTFKKKEEKISLLQQLIDDIVATFFRQAMFAEFEYTIHKLVEDNEPVTEQVLSKIASDLYKDYYGIDLRKEKSKRLWWAFIPHIYNSPFYVYKYATCFTITSKLYEDYKKESSKFSNFIDLLKAGEDDYPFEQILKRGVDLRKEETYMTVINELKILVKELESVIDAKE